jgi:ribosomal protein S27AE
MTDTNNLVPLDPSKVQAGDTVTLENGETSVRGPVACIETAKHTDVAIGFSIPNVGWRYLVPDVLAQQDSGVWTLTDHQPAPEPEPAWKPGTVAVVVQGGDPGAGVDDHEFRAALQTDGMWVGLAGEAATAAPVSVRPLVVLDPTATKCPECGDGLFVAMHDDEQWICRTCTIRELERVELAGAAAGREVKRLENACANHHVTRNFAEGLKQQLDVATADLGAAQDEIDAAYRAAAPDIDVDDRTESLTAVVERARRTTRLKVTKAVTQEELADVLAQHYGDHENLAAVPEQRMRQNYLSDARTILGMLGGDAR